MPGGAVFPFPLLGCFLGFFVHSAHGLALAVPPVPQASSVAPDIRREFGAPGIAVAVRALRTIGKFAMEVLIRKVGVSPLAVPTCRAPRLTLETHFLLCLS
jgi:hypothetical protein